MPLKQHAPRSPRSRSAARSSSRTAHNPTSPRRSAMQRGYFTHPTRKHPNRAYRARVWAGWGARRLQACLTGANTDAGPCALPFAALERAEILLCLSPWLAGPDDARERRWPAAPEITLSSQLRTPAADGISRTAPGRVLLGLLPYHGEIGVRSCGTVMPRCMGTAGFGQGGHAGVGD